VSAIDLFKKARGAMQSAAQKVQQAQTVTPMQVAAPEQPTATATVKQWVPPATPQAVTPMQPSAVEQIITTADNNMRGAAVRHENVGGSD
jgi:hypothetical protein